MIWLQRLFLILFINIYWVFNAFAVEPDWRAYAETLQFVSQGSKHGTQLALVDYQTIKEKGKLEAAYQQLSAFPVDSLSSQEEKLAYYINAYNMLALKMVIDHFPLGSIKDTGWSLSSSWYNM